MDTCELFDKNVGLRNKKESIGIIMCYVLIGYNWIVLSIYTI
jgi:hypothetical protein